MHRNKVSPLVLLLAAILVGPLIGPRGEATQDETGGPQVVAATTAPAGEEARDAATASTRSGRGFVCSRKVFQVSSGGATYKESGKVAVTASNCHDCCRENIIFMDDFESGNTTAWSVVIP